jgi:hypothetical protein
MPAWEIFAKKEKEKKKERKASGRGKVSEIVVFPLAKVVKSLQPSPSVLFK